MFLGLLFIGGVVLYVTLHQVLRFHLVRSVCNRVLQKNKKKNVILSEADVANITNKVISGLHALATSIVGLQVMWETADDCLYSRSQTILPFAYTAFSYLLCDLLSMYHAFCLGKDLPVGSGGSLVRFMRNKLFMVVHHLVLVVVGYPLVVHDWLRKGMGDFLVGTLFVREMSSPLLAAAKVMRQLRLEDTSLYRLNGGVFVVVFFLVRITNTPLTLLFFAAQHHNWSLLNALSSMRLICHMFLAAELTLQLYWFTQILRAALKRFYYIAL